MTKNAALINALKKIARENPETRAALVPLIRQASNRKVAGSEDPARRAALNSAYNALGNLNDISSNLLRHLDRGIHTRQYNTVVRALEDFIENLIDPS